MRVALLAIVLMLPEVVHADNVGVLLGTSDVDVAKFRQVRDGYYMLIPEAPLGGRAAPDAVRIAIIDSGVASKHPQLIGYLVDAKDFTGEGVEDELGHGTAVALIALFGVDRSRAAGALLSAKVANRDGKIREVDVIAAIDWVVARGAKVVNLSLGFTGTLAEHRPLCAAIAQHPGVFFTAAAGNSGPTVDVFPARCGSRNLFAVAEADDAGRISPQSGRGDVAAPSNTPFIEEWRYHYDRGQRLAREGRLREARVQYERSLAVEPTPEPELQLGLIDLNAGALPDAMKHFRRAIQLNPGVPEAHEFLGVALFLGGDYARAERELREAVALYGDEDRLRRSRARAQFSLGQTLVKAGRPADAKVEFLEVKRAVPDYPRIDAALETLP